MYEITVEGRFSAAHRHLLPDGQRPLHGHDFRVLVRLEGADLRNDVLLDFHELETGLAGLLERLGHQDLSSHPDFQERDATPAALARWLHGWLLTRYPPHAAVRLASVEVQDSERSGALYREP